MTIPLKRPFLEKLRTSYCKRQVRLRRRFAHMLGRDARTTRCRYYGVDFLVNIDDLIGYEIAIKRLDWREIKLMMDACERLRPDIFIDVGANIGLYSCILGKHQLVPRILAFEPDRQNFSGLRANIQINELSDIVDARPVAAGATVGTATLVPAGIGNRGLSKIGQDEANGYTVPIATLDDCLGLENRVIMIKIDVEDYELEVLSGAHNLLRANTGFAQIEGRDDHMATMVTTKMESLGWRCRMGSVVTTASPSPRIAPTT